MKKIASIFFSVVIFITTSLSLIVTCSAASAVVNFAIDTVLNYAKSVFCSHSDSSAKRIEAARSFYFYYIVNDEFASGKPIYDSTGHKFSDEILTFYFDQYWNTLSDGVVDFNDVYDSDGDIFLQAAGFPDTPWSLRSISFHQPVGSIDNTRYDNTLPTFKNYYNTYLARYLQAQGGTATDPNPGKTGLQIAPGYTTGADLKEAVTADNQKYFPKGSATKQTFRTNPYHEQYVNYDPEKRKEVYYLSVPIYDNRFQPIGTDDGMYFMFTFTDGTTTFYSKYQFHLYFDYEYIYSEDGSEIDTIKRYLRLKAWDFLNGETEKDAVELIQSNFDVSKFKYYFFQLYDSSSSSLRISAFDNSEDFLLNYYPTTIGASYFTGTYDSLFSTDKLSSVIYNDVVSNHKLTGLPSVHDTECTYGGCCDIGYVASNSAFAPVYDVDTSKIPDDAVITVGGDNIYNYYITNPETGESSTMNEYITNNYTYVTNNGGEGSGSSGGVGGNVTVGGEISVGGSVGVDINVSVPDININVNNGAGGTGTGASPNPEDFLGDSEVDLTSYYDKAVEDASGVRQFLVIFFDFLPAELLGLLCSLVAVSIICRLFGR